MKKIMNIFVVAALAAGITTSALAQDAGPKGGKGGQPGQPGAERSERRGPNMQRMMQMRKQMMDKLNLTADQKKKVAALDAKMKQQMEAAMKSSGGDRQKMMQGMRGMRQSYQKDLNAILTADQRKKFEQLMKERRDQMMKERGGVPGGKPGKPGKPGAGAKGGGTGGGL